MELGERVIKRRLTDALVKSVRAIRLAEARQLELVCTLVDAYATVPALPVEGGARLVPSGAAGTPLVDEFLVKELHPLLGCSEASAWALLADAANLRWRHPRLWELVAEGRVPVWQARQVAVACARLSVEAADRVDALIAPLLATVPWGRAKRRLAALVASAAPMAEAERRQAARADRFVSIRHTDAGTSWLVGLLSTADAISLGHAIDGIARTLIDEPGFVGTPANARADALGLLGRPGDGEPSGRRRSRLPRPEATLVVHVDRADLDRADLDRADLDRADLDRADLDRAGLDRAHRDRAVPGAGRLGVVEGPGALGDIGHVPLDELGELLGHHRVRVLPVIDLADDQAADGYVIPDRLRTQVVLRDRTSVFPFGTRRAAACDLDHTIAYSATGVDIPAGRPFPDPSSTTGQTRPSNLGSLDRRSHRAKTHAGWLVTQPVAGTFEWTSPLGYRYRVNRHGTRRLDGPGPRPGTQQRPPPRTAWPRVDIRTPEAAKLIVVRC